MKLLKATSAVMLFSPAAAQAEAPTTKHVRAYENAYYKVVHEFGHRAPGRQIVRWGFDAHHKATDQQVVTSLGVLDRMLAPPPKPVLTETTTTSTADSAATTYSHSAASSNVSPVSSSSSSTAPSSGLAACIVQRESSGNPQDVTGQYSGLADWSPSAWQEDGGTQYASSPTGASAADQMKVLNNALANGKEGQWRPYDGC